MFIVDFQLCIVFSLFAVSVVLFLVSRFSPNEWRIVSFTDSQSSEHNEVATTKVTKLQKQYILHIHYCTFNFIILV